MSFFFFPLTIKPVKPGRPIKPGPIKPSLCIRPCLRALHRPLTPPLLAIPLPATRSLLSPLPFLRCPRQLAWPSSSRTQSSPRSSSNAILAIVPIALATLYSSHSHSTLHLDSCPPSIPVPLPQTEEINPAQLDQIESILSLQKLSFGTLTGICAGVFIRKGLGLVAFVCGGAFVFLQFLHSHALLTINWSRWAARYDRALARPIKHGAPSLPRRLVEFLTADFQYRATFVAGLLLGLRVG